VPSLLKIKLEDDIGGKNVETEIYGFKKLEYASMATIPNGEIPNLRVPCYNSEIGFFYRLGGCMRE
jgi:hypothetical protein